MITLFLVSCKLRFRKFTEIFDLGFTSLHYYLTFLSLLLISNNAEKIAQKGVYSMSGALVGETVGSLATISECSVSGTVSDEVV